MAIPVITPQIPQIPLPSDIMARIAASRRAQQQARIGPALDFAKLQQLRSQTQQAGLPKSTSAQQAIDAYLTSFRQNPNSANTTLLGLAVRKAVAGSAGTSITTPDGTQVTFGGSGGVGGVGGTIPSFGSAPNDTTVDTGKQLSPDQQAIQRIFPEQPASPISQVVGTSGDRKTAGSTTVDSSTGAVTSRPTRTVTSLNQNSIESTQKLSGILPDMVNGFAPFAGIHGKGESFWDSLKVGAGAGTPAEIEKIKNLNASHDKAAAAATDLMRALGAPNVVQLENQFRKVFIPRWNETPTSYRKRIMNDLMTTVHEFTSKAQAAQIEGILVGKVQPKTGKIISTTEQARQIPQQPQVQQSTEDLVKQFRGQ